ncbi:hypothetical protein Y1Q_0017547 [Alligator mississippiensis]|uniref:Uncharacterized protein n=1 Tax=Alligator mississippiensis TaxID=8496 RepID=A0A151P2E4_ALLMI|nr:hypothetical protein Y1Q_0017547 [Alligator mississippiensis]
MGDKNDSCSLCFNRTGSDVLFHCRVVTLDLVKKALAQWEAESKQLEFTRLGQKNMATHGAHRPQWQEALYIRDMIVNQTEDHLLQRGRELHPLKEIWVASHLVES